MNYLVIIEKVGHNYSAYLPDVPGCVATGSTRDETFENIKQALALHLKGLKEDGLPLPKSNSEVNYISIPLKTL